MNSVAFATQWRGQRDTSRRRGVLCLLLALLLHAPLTPLALLFGLLSLLRDEAPHELVEVDAISAIPVDLIDSDEPGPSEPKPSEPPQPTAPMDDPFEDLANDDDDDDPVASTEDLDAGAESADAAADATAELDAGSAVAAADAGGSSQSAQTGPAMGDPVAMSGTAGKVVDANANVRLLIYNDRIRNHALGKRIGVMLGRAAQWKDFFGPAGLDPIQDVDRILIAGPQLRNSADVAAVLQYKGDPAKVRAAIDALVKRDTQKGQWLSDAGVPAALARADRAERVFVMPAPQIVIVAPPSAQKNALSQRAISFPAPKGNEALSAYVVTPWRALVGIPFKVPKSIKWVRLNITPKSDGGAVAELVAEDASAEEAQKNASDLTRQINALTQIPFMKLLEPVDLKADGNLIKGSIVATPSQLRVLLEAIDQLARKYQKQAEEKEKQKREAAERAAAERSDASAPRGSAEAPATSARPEAAPAESNAD